jgi:hypothetical protein
VAISLVCMTSRVELEQVAAWKHGRHFAARAGQFDEVGRLTQHGNVTTPPNASKRMKKRGSGDSSQCEKAEPE